MRAARVLARASASATGSAWHLSSTNLGHPSLISHFSFCSNIPGRIDSNVHLDLIAQQASPQETPNGASHAWQSNNLPPFLQIEQQCPLGLDGNGLAVLHPRSPLVLARPISRDGHGIPKYNPCPSVFFLIPPDPPRPFPCFFRVASTYVRHTDR